MINCSEKRGDNLKKTLLVFLLGLLCFGAIAVEAKRPTTTTTTSTTTTTTIKQIPWLGFHDVVADVHEATSDINVAFLNEWTQFLVDKGYTTLTYDQFYSYLADTNTTGLPEKVVILSFDDNYIGVYDYAYPRLSALGLNATNFVHTNYVGVVTSKDHCDWTELGEMETDGHIVAESHTRNHVDLTAVDGTSDTATRFLSKDNTWDVPSYTANTDAKYALTAAVKSGSNVPLTLTGSDGGATTTVNLTEGANITLTRNSSGQITIASTDTGALGDRVVLTGGSQAGGLTTFTYDVTNSFTGASAIDVKCEVISAAGETVYASVTRSGNNLTVEFTGSISDSAYEVLLTYVG